MNNNIKAMNEKMVPTTEVVNQKLAILSQMNAALQDQNYEEANAKLALSKALNEKYNFFDQVFEENGKQGVKDITGKVLVPALFSDFCETYHYDALRGKPLGALNEQGKCALVTTDGTGTTLTPFEYDAIHISAYDNYYISRQGDKRGVIQPNGTVVVPCIIDEIWEPVNGITLFASNGKHGLFTNWGTYVEPVYDEIEEKDEKPYARLGDTWGYLDIEGQFIAENDPELDNTDLLDYFMALP